jgi:hypothetical protein
MRIKWKLSRKPTNPAMLKLGRVAMLYVDGVLKGRVFQTKDGRWGSALYSEGMKTTESRHRVDAKMNLELKVA